MKTITKFFWGGVLALALGLGVIGVVGNLSQAQEVGATDTVITIDSKTWTTSTDTDHTFTLSGVNFTCSGIKNGSSSTVNYGYLMNNGGQIYNTSFPSGKYVSKVAVTYTSTTGTKGATVATFGSSSISTRPTTGGTTVVKSGSYSKSNANSTLGYFNLANTKTQNAQWDTVTITFSDPDASAPKLTLDSESLAVNKGGSGSVTATATNFTADHYVITSSDATIATGTASGNTITVSGLKAGTATLSIGGCATAGSDTISASASLAVTVNAQSVKASPAKTTIYVGGATRSVTLTPEYFNGSEFLYDASSSNTAVATVAVADSSVGAAVITPVAAGTATITYTVTDGNDTAEATTAVTVVLPTISFSETSVTMSLDSGTHSVTVTPNNFSGTPTLTATSNDTNKATVAVDGLNVVVTPVAEGDTSIYVTAQNADGQTANGSFNVSVIDQTALSNRLSVSGTSTNHLAGDIVPGADATSDLATWSSDFFSFTQSKNSAASSVVLTNNEIRAYSGHQLTLTPVTGVYITSVVFNCSSASYATALSSSTWSDNVKSHELPENGTVVTVKLLNSASAFSVTLSAQSRFDSIEVNYAFSTADAKAWATTFNGTLSSICSAGANNTTPSADLVSAWGTESSSFAALADLQKAYVKAVTASESGNVVAQAMAKYDYIMKKYGTASLANFVGRDETSSAGSIKGLSNEVFPIAAVASLAVIGLLTTAGVFLLKKKHQ
jgi:hypothetical protein